MLNNGKYKNYKTGEINEYLKIPAISWFTNLEHNHRHEEIILYKQYNKQDYPSYVNYDAINVDKIQDIPKDYDGAMGVPLTFLNSYNPDQFEIITLGLSTWFNSKNNYKMEILDSQDQGTGKFTKNGKGCLYLKVKDYLKPIKSKKYRNIVTGELYFLPYIRILIKKKQNKLWKLK